MCEICFDGSCSNPYNHPEAHELSLANLTQVGLDKMLDKIDEQFKLIRLLENKLEHISGVALADNLCSDVGKCCVHDRCGVSDT